MLDRLLGAVTAGLRAEVTRAVDTLRANALVVGDAEPHLLPAAAAAWSRSLGLGSPVAAGLAYRTAEELRTMARNLGMKPAGRKADILDQILTCLCDADRVRAIVAAAPAGACDLLATAAAGDTDRAPPPAPATCPADRIRRGRQLGPGRWADAGGQRRSARMTSASVVLRRSRGFPATP